MKLNNWSGKKKVTALLLALLVIVGLVVTIFLVQKSQENRTHAEKATTLSLTPPTQNIAPGATASLELKVNPGTNQVNSVKFTIKFDPAVFDPSKAVLTLDPNSPLKVIEGPIYTSAGTLAYSLGSGSDPTKVIQAITTIGTITLPSKDGATGGDYHIDFDKPNTQVRSIGSNDSPGEDVLQTIVGAVVSVQAICKPNTSTCSWDALDGATKYHFTVTDSDRKQVADGETSNTSTEFPSVFGKTYTCDVKALNDCGGIGEAGQGVSTCAAPSASPSTVPSGTPTLTPTVSPTKVLTSTPTPTTPGSTATPTPTTPGVTSTFTPTPTPTTTTEFGSSPTPTISTEVSAAPTLPPTGSPFVMGGILGGILILIGGLALLIL